MTTPGTESAPWYETSQKRILIDMHFPEWHDEILSRFDAEQMVSEIVRTGADTAFIHAKPHTGYAFYATGVGDMNQALKGRDIFGEFIREANDKGLNSGAYYSITWDDNIFFKHPEWRMRDQEGKDLGWYDLFYRAVCYLNSGYRDFIFQQVAEIAGNYPVDGFWFDILLYDSLKLGCYCDGCKRRFRDEEGFDMPTEPTWDEPWKKFLEFRYRMLQEFAEQLVSHVKGLNPKLSVAFNYHGTPGFGSITGQRPVQHTTFSDYGTGEIYPYCFGFVYVSMLPKFLAGLVANRTNEILTNMYVGSMDYTVVPVEELRWELLTARASGAAVTVWDEPYHDGSLNPVVYDRIKEVYDEIEEKKELFNGVPVKEVGIYYSAKTRDFYGREKLGEYTLAFFGAYKALLELHVQTGVLFDRNVTPESLMEYPILLLPNVAILDDREVEMITDYVRNGGRLIATGDTSLYSEDGVLEDFGLKALFDASFVAKVAYDYNYVAIDHPVYGAGIDPRYRIPCVGPGNIVRSDSDCQFGQLWKTFFERQPGKFFLGIHPPHEVVGPAILTNDFGDGKVIYVPFRLLAGYASEHAVAELRKLFGNLIASFGCTPPVTVTAPLTVEAVIREEVERNRFIVHLIGYNPTHQSVATAEGGRLDERSVPVMEEPPLYKAEVKVNVPYSKIDVFDEGTEILKRSERGIDILCSTTHAAVIIER